MVLDEKSDSLQIHQDLSSFDFICSTSAVDTHRHVSGSAHSRPLRYQRGVKQHSHITQTGGSASDKDINFNNKESQRHERNIFGLAEISVVSKTSTFLK